MYKCGDARGQVDTFIKTSNRKIKKKFDFILRYIADEKNQFKEPYVKHFSIEKYKRLYELRLKAAGMMVRIIFYNIEENIILLNAFIGYLFNNWEECENEKNYKPDTYFLSCI